MSQRSENVSRLALYGELDEIVGAMRNLARVELVRVKRAEAFQQAALDTALSALAVLNRHFPPLPPQRRGESAQILLGSERGFCGGFNEQVLRAFQEQTATADQVLVVGSRLAHKFSKDSAAAFFSGPSTLEDVLPCAGQLIDYLLRRALPAGLTLLSHHAARGVVSTPLLPAPALPAVDPAASVSIQLAPEDLRTELHWQCLQQGVVFYLLSSLSVENRFRLQQMEGAREHLEELSRALRLRINRLRQQEIVEEIEVILAEFMATGLPVSTDTANGLSS